MESFSRFGKWAISLKIIFVNITNQRGYSRLVFVFFFFWFVCFFMPGQFVYAHSRTVYQNTLNVLGFFSFSDLHSWLCWHCFLNMHFILHPTLCLSHVRRHMLWRPDICQNIDIEKTMIKLCLWDDIAWFIIFLILYVYFISQDHDGDD